MPQLDKATFQLQAVVLLFSFLFVYFLLYWIILPNIQISVFLREQFMLEVDEFLEINFFNLNKYSNFSISILLAFLQSHFMLAEKFFKKFQNVSYNSEIIELNEKFDAELFSYVEKKSKILYGISKLN